MRDPLQVTDIQVNGSEIHVKLHGRDKIIKIASHAQVLIRHKIVSLDKLRVGDEILAYGFDYPPSEVYNNDVSRVKLGKGE